MLPRVGTTGAESVAVPKLPLPFPRLPRALACLLALLATARSLPAQDNRDPRKDQGKSPADLAVMSGDWTHDAPGNKHRVNLNELPPPFGTDSAGNGPHEISRPEGAQLHVPPGFQIELYAGGFKNPRFLLTAPNGDIFVTESGPGRIRVLHDTNGDGKPDMNQVFADTGLNKPFGIAFYPPGPNPKYLYAANTDGVVRFPYHNGDLKATGPVEPLGVALSGGGLLRGGGHWTRDIVFSPDGQRMFVSVGSKSNVDESNNPEENERARIFEFKPDGTDRKVYASGIRNAVGIAMRPGTEDLWMSTNERDGLGDDLVPDYISRVAPGGFYGWPWFYMGNHPDPRKKNMHPELAATVLKPDVPVQSHSATLNLCFYTGKQFPAAYRGDIFAAFHGSWNRNKRTGYKIVRVPFDHETGQARGDYEDFVTGFVADDGDVWGRPVGITVAADGGLLFSEDTGNTIWKVSYAGK